MPFLQDFLDHSKQLNQTPIDFGQLAYHPPNKKYKYVHQAVIIPNLPAPIYYLNFSSFLGQSNVPMLSNPSAILTDPIDTVTVLSSVSPHMHEQLKRYSIQQDCFFTQSRYQFSDTELLEGNFPEFRVQRIDQELSFDLTLSIKPAITYLTHLRFGFAEHWSALCHCQGVLRHQQSSYQIQACGSFEYGRSRYLPYLPLVYFSYQIIQLQNHKQLFLIHVRDQMNHVVQSKIYVRDIQTGRHQIFDRKVLFKIHRVYPAVITPNGQQVYLPREFEWFYEGVDGQVIWIQAQSRGDFKFGLAAGYVGSFNYQIKVNQHHEEGNSGYIEYVDCRKLLFQEHDKNEKLLDGLANPVPFTLKK